MVWLFRKKQVPTYFKLVILFLFKFKDKAYRVQINLMDILEINEEKKYVRCEPMVSVQRLFEALQAKGYDVQYVSCSQDPTTISESTNPEFSRICIIFDENHSK